MLYITDKNGGKLLLTKYFLKEITDCAWKGECWLLNLLELANTYRSRAPYVSIYLPPKGERTEWRKGTVSLIPRYCVIGCRTFTCKDFKKILRAAGIRPKEMRSTK